MSSAWYSSHHSAHLRTTFKRDPYCTAIPQKPVHRLLYGRGTGSCRKSGHGEQFTENVIPDLNTFLSGNGEARLTGRASHVPDLRAYGLERGPYNATRPESSGSGMPGILLFGIAALDTVIFPVRFQLRRSAPLCQATIRAWSYRSSIQRIVFPFKNNTKMNVMRK